MTTRHVLGAGAFGCLMGLVFVLAAWLASCVTTPAPKCPNVENCDNPADYPPLNDDRTLFAVRKDGGR